MRKTPWVEGWCGPIDTSSRSWFAIPRGWDAITWLSLLASGGNVILAHGMIDKLVPHQNAAQIGMPFKSDAEQIENFPLLKFATAPDRRQGGQRGLVRSIFGAQPDDQRAVAEGHRVKMINRFQVSRSFGSIDPGFLFHAVNFLTLTFSLTIFSGQSTPVTLEA